MRRIVLIGSSPATQAHAELLHLCKHSVAVSIQNGSGYYRYTASLKDISVQNIKQAVPGADIIMIQEPLVIGSKKYFEIERMAKRETCILFGGNNPFDIWNGNPRSDIDISVIYDLGRRIKIGVIQNASGYAFGMAAIYSDTLLDARRGVCDKMT